MIGQPTLTLKRLFHVGKFFCFNYFSYLWQMKYILILTTVLFSCKGFYPMSISTPSYFEVKCVSPGTNGLSIYYLKSKNIKGKLMMVDSNDKHRLGDQFKLFKIKN
jgi:hypothetical protein